MNESSDNSSRYAKPAPRAGVKRGRAPLLWVAVLVAVFAILFGIGLLPRLQTSKAIAETARDTLPVVTVVPAKRGSPATELSLPGTLQPFQETPVFARTNGYVKRWLVDIGAKVKAGQLLAEIETPEIDQELKQAIATRAQVKANLDLAKITADRWQVLLKDKAVAQQEVDEKFGALEARKADLAAAQASVERLQELQQFQHVVAPFDGVITARNVEVGWLINAGSSGPNNYLYKVAKTQILRLYVNVPQSHTRLIRPDMPADILIAEAPGKAFPGKVLRFSGALDPQSKTLLTEVQVPNEHGELLAGMYAQVRFKLTQAEPAILLPSSTLIVRAAGPQVAAIQNSTVRVRKIILGRDFGQQIEVLSGVAENEMIVINPTDAMREGAQVKVAQSTPDKK
jgi:RND family efflux transporter MFP subunit